MKEGEKPGCASSSSDMTETNKVLKSTKETFEAFKEPDPPFTFKIGWSKDYDNLLRGEVFKTASYSDLYREALRCGRVILCAQGGAAKSVILRKIGREAIREKCVAVLIDLKRWTAPDYQEWNRLGDSPSGRLQLICSRFSEPSLTTANLDLLQPSLVRLLLIDGVNEVSSPIGQSIIDLFNEFVRTSINTNIIVADRLTRRDIADPEEWAFATVMPLEESEVKSQVVKMRGEAAYVQLSDETKLLLASPYFLNAFLQEGVTTPTRAQTLHQYFQEHGGNLTEPELQVVSKAAFIAYQTDRSRTFRLDRFEAEATVEVTQKLKTAGALIVADGLAYFNHHLKHDYLVSYYLASDEELWSPDSFNVATFFASSFDVLAMTLEQISEVASADKFVRRIYDWNYYGAAYAVAEALNAQTVVSQEMQVVLLAMLAERKWDLITATAQRAKDALLLFRTGFAQRLVNAASLGEVFKELGIINSGENWFNEWRNVYTTAPGSIVDDSDVEKITVDDSVLGWTYANVLKRVKLADSQQALLRGYYANASEPVRWRISHVLGAFPDRKNAEFLLTLLDSDPKEWVRYGAIRSLVEIAALTADTDLRKFVFLEIEKRAATLLKTERTVQEFARAIFVQHAPKDWIFQVSPVIEEFFLNAASVTARDQWEKTMHRLRTTYSA
jgi:hypothetical protein